MVQPAEYPRFYCRKRFWQALVAGLIVLFGLYLLAGFFLLPWALRGQLTDRLSAITGRPVAVDKVRANPLLFTVSIEGFRMAGSPDRAEAPDSPGAPPDLLRFDRLLIDLSVASLGEWAPVFDRIRWEQPRIDVSREADGKLSFEDVFERLTKGGGEGAEEEDSGPARFAVERLEIVNGSVRLQDQAVTPVFAYEATPINFTLVHFGTLEEDAESSLTMEAETAAGARIAWTGAVAPAPFRSDGTIVLEGVAIEPFQPYIQSFFEADFGPGRAHLELPYHFNAGIDAELLALHDGTLRVEAIEASAPDSEQPFFELQTVAVDGIELQLTERSASVASVRLQDGGLSVERSEDGTFRLLELIPDSAETGEPAEPWSYTVATVNLQHFALHYVDKGFAESFEYRFGVDALTINNLSDAPEQPMELSLVGTTGESGRLEVGGTVRREPLAADLQLSLNGIALEPFAPIPASISKITALEGRLDLNGSITASEDPESEEPIAVEFGGNAGVTDLTLADSADAPPLLTLERISLGNISAGSAPTRFSAETLVVERPQIAVIRTPEGQLNWLMLPAESTGGPEAASPDTAEPEATATDLQVEIAEITVREGSIAFEDRSVDPPVQQSVQNANLSVRPFTLSGDVPIQLQLEATLQELARVEGDASWLAGTPEGQATLNLVLNNFQVPPLSPYSSHFVGRSIASGELSLDLRYSLEQAHLDGDQSITIERFDLGPETPGDAVLDLPVGLAVSLLKNREGTVSLDVPLSGNLSDPQFSITGVVRQAFTNVIRNAATAPFRLLGSVFGGGGTEPADLSFVAFQPGSNELDESARQKLETLAHALYERPELTLAYFATIDPEADRNALARRKLDDHLRRFQAENAVIDSPPEAGIDLEDPAVYRELLASAYREEQSGGSVPEEAGEAPQAATQADSRTPSDDSDKTPAVRRSSRPGSAPLRFLRVTRESGEPDTEPSPAPSATSAADENDDRAEAPPTQDEMETALLETIEVTEADFTALRTAREEAVRRQILEMHELDAQQLQAAPSNESPAPEVPPGAVVFEVR